VLRAISISKISPLAHLFSRPHLRRANVRAKMVPTAQHTAVSSTPDATCWGQQESTSGVQAQVPDAAFLQVSYFYKRRDPIVTDQVSTHRLSAIRTHHRQTDRPNANCMLHLRRQLTLSIAGKKVLVKYLFTPKVYLRRYGLQCVE